MIQGLGIPDHPQHPLHPSLGQTFQNWTKCQQLQMEKWIPLHGLSLHPDFREGVEKLEASKYIPRFISSSYLP